MITTHQAINAVTWREYRYIPHVTQDLRQGVWSDLGICVGVMEFDINALQAQFVTHFPVKANLSLWRTQSGMNATPLDLHLYAGNQTGMPPMGDDESTDAPRPLRVTGVCISNVEAGQGAKSVYVSPFLIESVCTGESNCIFMDAGDSADLYMSFRGRNELSTIQLTIEWEARPVHSPLPPTDLTPTLADGLMVINQPITIGWKHNPNPLSLTDPQTEAELRIRQSGGTWEYFHFSNSWWDSDRPWVPGDINGDGIFDQDDVAALEYFVDNLRLPAGYRGHPLDISGDGTWVTDWDVTTLQNVLNGTQPMPSHLINPPAWWNNPSVKIPGDFNGDGVVDQQDVEDLRAFWDGVPFGSAIPTTYNGHPFNISSTTSTNREADIAALQEFIDTGAVPPGLDHEFNICSDITLPAGYFKTHGRVEYQVRTKAQAGGWSDWAVEFFDIETRMPFPPTDLRPTRADGLQDRNLPITITWSHNPHPGNPVRQTGSEVRVRQGSGNWEHYHLADGWWNPGRPWVPGDLNGDGVFNNEDVQVITGLLMGNGLPPTYRGHPFDISGDGALTSWDATFLAQILDEIRDMPMHLLDPPVWWNNPSVKILGDFNGDGIFNQQDIEDLRIFWDTVSDGGVLPDTYNGHPFNIARISGTWGLSGEQDIAALQNFLDTGVVPAGLEHEFNNVVNALTIPANHFRNYTRVEYQVRTYAEGWSEWSQSEFFDLRRPPRPLPPGMKRVAITEMRVPVKGTNRHNLALPVTSTDGVIHSRSGISLTTALKGYKVNNATITFTQGGAYKGSFRLNQNYDKSINFDSEALPPAVDPVFGNNSWADIAAASEQFIVANNLEPGDLDMLGWNLGDTKTFEANGVTYYLRIIGVNHDDRVSGGKAGLTLEMSASWGAAWSAVHTARMNATRINTTGWDRSMMRLGAAGDGGTPNANEPVLPWIREAMPAELMAVVKPVLKLTSDGNPNGFSLLASQDDLFLLSHVEVFGPQNTSMLQMQGEGTQYLYYEINSSDEARVKLLAGNANTWALRTPSTFFHEDFGDAYSYFGVSGTGTRTVISATSASAVSFALCI